MIDMKQIRQNFDTVLAKLKTRGVDESKVFELRDLDETRRNLLVKVEEMKKERNEVSDQIAQMKREKQDASAVIEKMRLLGQEIKGLDEEVAVIDEKMKEIAVILPNLPADDVPVGADEDENVEVRRWGTPREFDFEPKPHWEIGEELGILDFEREQKFQVAVSYTTKA